MPNYEQVKRSELKFGRVLGTGGFSTVYHAIWTLVTSMTTKEVAVKKLNAVESGELDIMSKLDHTHIIKLLGVVDEAPDFFLILELCNGGTLREYLDQLQTERLPFDQFFGWAKQAASPLEYLRSKGIVHKDIKSPNYLIAGGNVLKLADFGTAKEIDITMSNATTTASYPWMAPELVKHLKLSTKYDIFSYGVVLWELWTTKFPHRGLEPQVIAWRVCHKNQRLFIPFDCPKLIADLIRQCWVNDWTKRPDIDCIQSVIARAAVVPPPTEAEAASAEAEAAKEARQKQLLDGPWKLEGKIGDGWPGRPGRLVQSRRIAVSPNEGTIAVADWGTNQVQLYNKDLAHMYSLDTQQVRDPNKPNVCPLGVTFASDGTCYVTISTRYVLMYGVDGVYKGKWPAVSPQHKASDTEDTILISLTTDSTGQILVGEVTQMYISKHKPGGLLVLSIKLDIAPSSLAMTSRDEIIVSDWCGQVHIVDKAGQLLHTIKSPSHVKIWDPRGAAYYEDIICVCNEQCIHCYSMSEYMGDIPISIGGGPTHLAFTPDGKQLMVSCGISIAVYKLQAY